MKIVRKDYSRLTIDPSSTALLVIDMQKAFLTSGSREEIPAGRAIIPTLEKLIDYCRKVGILVIYTRISHEFLGGVYKELFPDHYKPNGRPYLSRSEAGFGIIDRLKPIDNDIIIDKDRYSPFFGTNLDVILRDRRIDTVIISGVATNVCCEAAARDAFSRDLRVIFLSNGNATLNKKMHEATLETVKLCLGYVIPASRVYDIVKSPTAGTP